MKTKVSTKEYLLSDERVLTLSSIAQDNEVVRFNPNYDPDIIEEKREPLYIHVIEGTLLSVGWAVKNPTDKVSPADLGTIISIGRANNKPVAQLILSNGRISETLQGKIMDAVAEEMSSRFYSFVPLSNNGKTKSSETGKKEERRKQRTLGSSHGNGHWDAEALKAERTDVHLERSTPKEIQRSYSET